MSQVMIKWMHTKDHFRSIVDVHVSKHKQGNQYEQPNQTPDFELYV